MDSDTRMTFRMRGGLLVAFVVTVVVTVFLGLIGFFLLRDLSWQARPDLVNGVFGGALGLLGAGVVGGLWIWVLRTVLRGRHYGDAELELVTAPVRLGGKLEGRVRAKATLATDEAINVVMQCWATRSGGGDSGSESQLRWDSETLLRAEEVELGNGELSIPIDLAIPADQPATGEAESRWEISWTLTVKFEPNTGYSPAFDIQVEPSGGSAMAMAGAPQQPAPVLLKSQRTIVADPKGPRTDESPPTRPPHARVRVERLPDGVTNFTPPKKMASSLTTGWCLITLPLWVILPIWGLADLKGVASPPLIAYLVQLGVAFGAAFILNGLPLLGHALWNRGVRLGPDGVVTRRPLGQKRYPPGHFTRAEAAGSSHDKWIVSLERSTRTLLNGLIVTIVSTEAEARWLISELSRALENSL